MSIRLTVCLTALVGLTACDTRAPDVVAGPGKRAVERGAGKQDAKPYEERDRSRDGAISGRVTLKGDPPWLPKPPVTQECRAHGDVPSERIMVDGQGGAEECVRLCSFARSAGVVVSNAHGSDLPQPGGLPV